MARPGPASRAGRGRLGRQALSFFVCFSAFAFYHFVVLFSHNVSLLRCRNPMVSRTMKTRPGRFNVNLALLAPVLAGLAAGCAGPKSSTSRQKLATTLNFYVATNPDALARHVTVTVGRNEPFQLVVHDQPFLSEIFVVEANVVDVVGGFQLALKFDSQGSRLLE